MRLEQIKRSPYFEDYKKYCIRDVELLRTITLRLASKFPKSELMIMDMVLKMATMPVFCADVWGLKQHYNGVITKKEELLKKVGVNRDELLSNDKFIDAIKALGITPGVKVSPRTGELAWATAKNDPWMMDMAEHPNEDVQALVAARIGVKSTLEETRTLRFISIARSFESVYGKPMLPVPLRYAGAHTHRFSGEWKINMQNLPGRKSKKLRECLVAPRGYVIMAVDASQIEARLTAWLAGEKNLLEQFRNKEDVYCNFASLLYNFPVTRANEIERFTGKTCVLGLGFQMGAKKLLRTATEQAKDNGYDIEYTLEQCELYVQTFRRTFRKIKELWYGCQQIINWMANKTIPLPLESEPGIRIGPCEVRNEMIVLPSGLCLYYYDIQPYEQGYSFRFGNRWKKLYGGLMVENVVQALDRQHVMEAAVRIQERTGFRPAHQVHDELIYVIPESELDTLRVIALEEMRTPCSWAEGLPLDAEVKVGQSYGELRKC
jgi:DNA polymerase